MERRNGLLHLRESTAMKKKLLVIFCALFRHSHLTRRRAVREAIRVVLAAAVVYIAYLLRPC